MSSVRIPSMSSQLQVGRYQWCPGNGSRYDVLFGMVQRSVSSGRMGLVESDDDADLYCLTWLKRGGSGGGTIVFSGPVSLMYLCEKMDIGPGDGRGLLDFLAHMDIEVVG